jgi:hypothetical protein
MINKPPRISWRNVSTHNLPDFEGYDGERLVARILQEPNGNHDRRWGVFAICPAIPGITNGVEADPKEARQGGGAQVGPIKKPAAGILSAP